MRGFSSNYFSVKGFFGPNALTITQPKLLTPPAGSPWILRTTYPLAAIKTVGGNATRLVALDGAGHTAYSDNHGATWTLGTGLGAIDGVAIATNGTNLWVVSSSTGNIYTSTDGATWGHAVDIGPLQGAPTIVFGNGLFVLGAQSSAQVVDCYTSANGTVWTGQGTNTPNQLAVQLYDGTDFVASGTDAGGNPLIGGSPTGAAWTTTTVLQFTPNNNIIALATHGGVYVGTDQSFPSVIQSSPSATAWVGTDLTQPLTSDVQGVAFGEGLWCLVGDVTGDTVARAATSATLSGWTLEDLSFGPTGFQHVVDVVAAAGTLVAWTNNGLISTRG